MNAEWSEALARAVRDVFEQLCFMLPGEDVSAAGERVSVEVAFHGARSGVLSLSLPEPMVAKVAAAMLGEDEPLALTEQHAAIRELSNIVCGNALPSIVGERAVCELESPRVLAAGGAPSASADAEAEVSLDEGVVSVRVALSAAQVVGAA